jgi:O-acetyl-ADP-ribose deacetylase (regulator of RNase III)
MKFKFFAIDQPLYDAWRKYLGDLDFISVHYENIFNQQTDCVVSPANSFGYMDGGIDALYTRYFGPKLQQRLQQTIQCSFRGELLVGQSILLETGHEKIPYMISSPTMRLPTKLPKNTENPYLAMRATLIKLLQNPDKNISTVSIPGFGTGVGGVDPVLCAAQVRRAIDDIWLDKFTFPTNFNDAVLPFTNRIPGDYND